MNDQQVAFVEAFGRYYEASGASRTAGRMLAWLMICEPAEKTAAQLVEELAVSAGSVSMVVRQLARVGLVERITFPGKRAAYYRLRDHAWIQAMDARMDGIRELHQLAERARTVAGADRPDRVEDLVEVTEFFLDRWPRLMDELHETVAHRTGAPNP